MLVLLLVAGCAGKQFKRDMERAHARIEGAPVMLTKLGPIEYVSKGEGPPILVVHGAVGGYDQGLAFAGLLADGFQVISVSRFGYLGSPIPENPSMELQADVFAALLDELGIDKVAILGGSAGGLSTLQFALRHPDRTSHVIMVCTLSIPLEKPTKLTPMNRFIFGSDRRLWRATRSRKKFLKVVKTPRSVIDNLTPKQAAWADAFRESMHPASRRYEGLKLDDLIGWAPKPYPLEKISAPTLVFHAKDDPGVDIEHARHMGKRIPNVEVIEYPDGGHLMFGHHADMEARIREFLRK
jgi:pimeloyl-ACP methyl ester carboxylesterase